jgi:uncharacterized membrane protein
MAAYMTGGVNATINLFYLVILFAARYRGIQGGVLVGLMAGIVGGPLLPDDVFNGVAQHPSQWSIRMVFYMMIGIVAGHLFSSLKRKSQEIESKNTAFEHKHAELVESREEIIERKMKSKNSGINLKNKRSRVNAWVPVWWRHWCKPLKFETPTPAGIVGVFPKCRAILGSVWD